MMDIVDPKNSIRVPYYGPNNMRTLIAYTPFRNLNVGNFVFVRSHYCRNYSYFNGKSGR
jgi:hypothetical protein